MSEAGLQALLVGLWVSEQSFHSFPREQWCLQDVNLVNMLERLLVNFRATGIEQLGNSSCQWA